MHNIMSVLDFTKGCYGTRTARLATAITIGDFPRCGVARHGAHLDRQGASMKRGHTSWIAALDIVSALKQGNSDLPT